MIEGLGPVGLAALQLAKKLNLADYIFKQIEDALDQILSVTSGKVVEKPINDADA